MQKQTDTAKSEKKVYHKPEISSEKLCADVALCACEEGKAETCMDWADSSFYSS